MLNALDNWVLIVDRPAMAVAAIPTFCLLKYENSIP
jgi:hypothetical protein